MARAVAGWSPVIMTGVMPAAMHSRTAAAASGRGGIDQADQPEQAQVAFERLGGAFRRQRGVVALRDRQHPQSARRHRLGPCQPRRRGRPPSRGIGAQRDHRLGRALGVGDEAAGRPVHGGHALALGVERMLQHARAVGLQLGLVGTRRRQRSPPARFRSDRPANRRPVPPPRRCTRPSPAAARPGPRRAPPRRASTRRRRQRPASRPPSGFASACRSCRNRCR